VASRGRGRPADPSPGRARSRSSPPSLFPPRSVGGEHSKAPPTRPCRGTVPPPKVSAMIGRISESATELGQIDMNLYRLLQQRADAGRPVRVGLIGAGKFGSMFLSQVPTTPGLEIAVIADLDPERARATCRKVGWDAAQIARTRFVASGAEA